MQVNEVQAYDIGCQLARDEGIMSGISSGAAVYAALQIGCRPENRDRLIVVIQPSGGERYLSTPMFAHSS